MTAVTSAKAPYVGPRALDRGEPLYGRDREVRELLDLIVAERVVLLYSPSGAGKTSLIQSKVLPRLEEEEGFHVPPVIRVNLEPPPDLVVPPSCNRYIFSALMSLESEDRLSTFERRIDVRELPGMDLEQYLALRGIVDENIILVFDQLEEALIERADAVAKREFFRQVGVTLRNRDRWALFAIREDFVAPLDPYVRLLPTRLRTRYRLDFLDERAARQAVQLPAQEAGVAFSEEAATRLVDDLRRVWVHQPDGSSEQRPGPYVEPVQLQVVCLQLWERLPKGVQKIDVGHVDKLGSVDTALADYYSEQVIDVAGTTGVSEAAIRDWFDHQLITDQGFRNQVPGGPDGDQENVKHAMMQLIGTHLIRAETRRGASWYELAHDRLIEPIKASNAQWREAHADWLQRQAEEWERQHRPAGLLLRGDMLVKAEQLAKENPHASPPIREFLATSQESAAKEVRRRNRVLRGFVAGFGILSAITLLLATVALQQRNTVRREAAKARVETHLAGSRLVAAQSVSQLGDRLDRALLLAVEAMRISPTIEAHSALLNALQGTSRRLAALSIESGTTGDVAFSPDGRLLAFGTRQGDVMLWDLSRREPVATLPVTSKVTRLAFGPAGTLATGTSDGRVLVWNIIRRRPAIPPLRHGAAVTALSVSSTGNTVISGGEDGTVIIWRAEDGTLLKPIRIGARITSLALARGNVILAIGSTNRSIVFWNIKTGLRIATLPQRAEVRSLAFSPNGTLLAAGRTDKRVLLLDRKSRRTEASLLGHTGAAQSVTFSPDGKMLASGSSDKTVILWDVSRHQRIGESLSGHSAAVSSVAFAPDGETIATSSPDRSVLLYNTHGQSQLASILSTGQRAGVTSVAIADDSRMLASGSADGTVRLWDGGHQARARLLSSRHRRAVTSLSFMPGGRILASGSNDGSILLWDVRQRRKIGPSLRHSGAVTSIVFVKGNVLVSGGRDGTIKLWDIARSRPLGSISTRAGPVSSLAVSRSNQLLAAGMADRTIVLWDVDGRRPLRTLRGHTDSVISLAFAPDDKMLASGGNDRTIMIWDPTSGRQLGAPLTGHTAAVSGIAFNIDGTMLASGDFDQTINLWDVPSLRLLGPLVGHDDGVTGIAFSPDGRTLVSGSRDKTLILWNVDVPSWTRLACHIAGRNLNQSEWNRFIGATRPYETICPQ